MPVSGDAGQDEMAVRGLVGNALSVSRVIVKVEEDLMVQENINILPSLTIVDSHGVYHNPFYVHNREVEGMGVDEADYDNCSGDGEEEFQMIIPDMVESDNEFE